jgi:hypothetical protein
MNRTFMLPLLCALVLPAFAATDGPNRRSPQKKAENQVTAKPRMQDACKLLTSDEIQSVQGERVEEIKPGAQPGGDLRISECIFRTATPAKAVSLALAEPSRGQPRDYWRTRFHGVADRKPDEPGAKDKEADRDGDDSDASRPRVINDLGSEAFWVGGRVTGALYVLRNNSFIRISVGGVRDESARIARSVALARAVLKRL